MNLLILVYILFKMLQVGSVSGSDGKSTGSGGPKINGSGSSSLSWTQSHGFILSSAHLIITHEIEFVQNGSLYMLSISVIYSKLSRGLVYCCIALQLTAKIDTTSQT